jgi:hypothetical protein
MMQISRNEMKQDLPAYRHRVKAGKSLALFAKNKMEIVK